MVMVADDAGAVLLVGASGLHAAPTRRKATRIFRITDLLDTEAAECLHLQRHDFLGQRSISQLRSELLSVGKRPFGEFNHDSRALAIACTLVQQQPGE